MLSLKATITTKEGLNSRAAAALVQQTNKYICDIFISHHSTTIDGKSIMGILALGLGPSAELVFSFDGVDEHVAKAAIADLIAGELTAL